MSFSTDQSRTKRPCGISSFLPLGMSCRDRAEAFARSLQSRLRTLGSQASTPSQPVSEVPEPPAPTENSWLVQPTSQVTNSVNCHTDSEFRSQSESFFDFDIEPQSPASPAEECEYIPLEKSDNEVNGIGSKSPSPTSSGESHASSDGPFFDPECSDTDQRSLSLSVDYYDCVDSKGKDQLEFQNGYSFPVIDSDSCSESLPQSQSTTTSLSTFTVFSSASNNTLQDEAMPDVVMSRENFDNLENSTTDDDITDINIPRSDESNEYIETFTLEIPKLMPFAPEVYPEPAEQMVECIQINEITESGQLNVTNGEELAKPQRVRRCSSLKTGKTPPGTPGRKKFVRFADVFGLDLADVKTFMDEIPTVPQSAYADLNLSQCLDEPILLGPTADRILMPLFEQPGGMPGFLDLVREQKVCLENAAVTDPICMTITGSVRVRNLDFNKSVHLRYSLDGWLSYSDFQANYIENSCDGFSDKFSFTIFGNSLQIGQRLEMAVRFSCKGEQFWDSNFGVNYCFQCLPATALSKSRKAVTPDEESWSGTFY